MAEERADPSSRSFDSHASTLALAGASRDEADALLRKQRELIDLQIEDLKREDAIRHWSLRIHHISDVLKLTFELAVAVILGTIVLGIGMTVWSAAHENGLVIEAFSVPPDLAAKGLTGQAIAAKLQDKLAAMQAATDSARPAASYSNNWGNDIKVQIPDTGVSVGEFYRMQVMWFGHQSHITGEVYHTRNGLAISVRASGDGGDTVTGTEDNLDALAQTAAEKIYAHTQPYRYAVYVMSTGRRAAEGRAMFEHEIAHNPSALERGWAWIGLGSLAQYTGDLPAATVDYRRAAALIPGFSLAQDNLDGMYQYLGHDEEALAAARAAVQMKPDDPNISERVKPIALIGEKADIAEYLGDYRQSTDDERAGAGLPDYSGIVDTMRENLALDLARAHDVRGAREAERALPAVEDPFTPLARKGTAVQFESALGDWQGVLADGQFVNAAYDAALKAHTVNPVLFNYLPNTMLWPYMAWAKAELGDRQGAWSLIGRTPLDCTVCLRVRARLAARDHDFKQANAWYARATGFAPSIPLAWSEWGEMLLRQGNLDGAIAKFTIANQKGPHFADPLELWGEALIAKNRSDLALAKFEEAANYAPYWGRLHLKWGQALLWTGDREGAKKQFAIARALSLTGAEQGELVRMGAHE